jgi:hypothetical protein
VSHADRPAIDELDHGLGQLEESHQVGDRDARSADRLRHLLMGQRELVDETSQRSCLLRRRELLALNVLHQRKSERLGIGQLADDRRDFHEARKLRGLPAPVARDNLELVRKAGHRPYQDGLDESFGLDGFRKLFERLLSKLGAGLHAAAPDGCDGNRPDAGAVKAARLLRIEKRLEAATQTLTLDAHAETDYPLQPAPSIGAPAANRSH